MATMEENVRKALERTYASREALKGSSGSSAATAPSGTSKGSAVTYKAGAYSKKVNDISIDAVVNSANELFPEYGSITDGASASKWFESAYNAIEEMNAYNSQYADQYQKEYGGEAGQRIKQLLGNADAVGEYLRTQQDNPMYSQWDQMLSEYRNALHTLDTGNQQRTQYYSQFKDENEYKQVRQQNEWIEKYQGHSVEEMRTTAAGMEAGTEKDWLTNYADYTEYSGKLNYDVPTALQELDSLRGKRKEMEADERKYKMFTDTPFYMLIQGDEYNRVRDSVSAFWNQGGMEALDKEIVQKEQRLREAQQVQNAVKQQQEHEAWLKTVRDPEAVATELETAQAQMQKLGNELQIFRQTYNSFSERPDLIKSHSQTFGELQREMLNIQQQYEATQAQMEALEKEYWWGRNQEYSALMGNADFADKSRYVSTKFDKPVFDPINRVYAKSGFADIDYDYINRNPEAIGQQMLIDANNKTLQWGTDQSQRQEMTDDEIKIYNYLYATEGKETAKKYVSFLNSELNKRQRAANEAAVQELASAGILGGAVASGLSVLQAPFKGASYLGQAVDYLTDGKIDQSAGYNKFAYTSSAMRNKVAEQIQTNVPQWGEAGAFGYQLLMSMGDFLYNGTLAGGSSAVATAIMGTGAAADTVIDAKDRGLNDTQAFTLGTVAGVGEALTERFSLEKLLDADLLRHGMTKYILTNTLTEGSEEVASGLVNLVADILVSGEESEWKQAIKSYQDVGYTEGEAFGKALADQVAALGLDFLGGAISGGVMGTGGAYVFGKDTRAIGRDLSKIGMDADTAQNFINTGMQADPETTSYQVSSQIQNKMNQGKILTVMDKGRLAQANPELTSRMIQDSTGKVRLATPFVNVGNTDVRWQQAQRLATISGRNIIFYNGSETENGYYDSKSGEIYVNVNGGDTTVQVFSHELTHSTEMSDVYADLQKAAFQKLRNMGQDIHQMRQEKMELYERNGHPLESTADAEKEIVAEFVQNYLLTDERVIADVVYDSPSLGRKILNWIDNLLAKLGNEAAQERVFLTNTRKLYSKALEQTRRQPDLREISPQTVDVSVQTAAQEYQDSMDEIHRAYESGELDEVSYQAIADGLQQDAKEKGIDLNRKYSFAGERAWTADMNREQRKNTPPNLGDDRTVFAESAGKSYSIVDIAGEKANYGSGVLLDTNIFDGVRTRDWGTVLSRFVYQNLAGAELTMYDDAGNPETIYLARENDRVRKDGAKNSHKVIDKLARYKGDNITALATVHISELLATSNYEGNTSEHNHQWMDEHGWQLRKAYLQDRNGNIYEALLNIADGRERKTLYAISNVRQIDKRVAHGDVPSTKTGRGSHIKNNSSINNIAKSERNVNKKYSLHDSERDNITQAGNVRDNLNRKGSDYLKRVENRLIRDIGNKLSVPRYAQWDYLRPVVQSMVDEYLETGKISDESMQKSFDKAYDQGKMVDREFYEQYRDIKEHLRTTAVTLSEQDRSDVADFNLWRQGAFGTLRIVNEGGLPVDVAYHELHNMAPELFPQKITHPADQLQRMLEVGKSIRITERSLDEYHGQDAQEYRKWAKHDFECGVGDIMHELRTVKRYAEQEQTETTRKSIQNEQEAEQAFRDRKRARRVKEIAQSRNLLSDKDKRIVSQLLSGIATLEQLDESQYNVKGIREVYEASREYEELDRQIRCYQAELRQKRQTEADKYLGSSLYWRDKKNGFSYKRETMRRNILDIVNNRSDAERLLRKYFEPVQQMEAQRQRFLTEWRDKVRALNLSTKPAKGDLVSEAYAVQLYGEAMSSIQMIQESRGRMKERDGRDIRDWNALVMNLFNESPNLNREKIENAVRSYRKMYDSLFQKMNQVLVRNGYPPVEYRKGYFPHFQGQDDGIMAKFGRLLGINIIDDVLPTTINGMTHKFKPGKQWFAHAQERLGIETTYDAVEGFDKYIEGVSNVLFHTDNIQNLRALAKQIRYRSSDQGIRDQVKAIQEDDTLSDYEKEHKIDEVYESGKFALSNFVRELEEYTNLLAGKKSISDRGTEHWLSRKYYTWVKQLESQVGANMIGGNITSAMTNFIPLTQAWGQLDTRNLLAGMRDTLMGMRKSDGFVVQSDFLTNRRGSEALTQSWLQKASSVAGLPMEWIDNFTSEAITRGAYYQNLKRGMSQQEALHQADLFAADVMGDRSKGAMPTVFEMKNPFAKVFTQFQLEVNNQLSEVFKDLPRAARDKTVKQIAAMVFKYFFGAWMFNELYEKLIGRRPALDPINMVWEAVEDWQDEGLFEAGQNLAANVAESLPFIGGVLGGGRVPIAGALPDVQNVWKALTEKPYDEETGEGISMPKRLHTLGTELSKPAMLIAFPLAGNQVMKSWKGIKALIDGGSYSMDNAGNQQLQYAVHMDDPWTAFGKALMASVMGKNALPEAREWAADGYDSLNAEQTAVYRDLLGSGAESREAYQLIDNLRSAQKTETESRAVVQRELLDGSAISDAGKAIVYYGMLACQSEQEMMDKLTDLGASEEEVGNVVRKLWDADQLDSDQQKVAEEQILKESSLTDEEKREVVASILGTDMLTEKGYPSEYAKFLTATDAGLSVDSYMKMRSKGVYMDDYFKFTDTGMSCEQAADISVKMKELKPDAGYSTVSYLQRCQVVLDADLSELGKLEALAAVSGLYDSTYEKIELGYNFGMNLQSYVDLKRTLPKYDANGNGSYTAKETKAAIDGGCSHLSNTEKAILWQLQNKSWKAKNNPYDRNVGQQVYDAMHAMSEDATEAEPDPYYLMRLLSIIE